MQETARALLRRKRAPSSEAAKRAAFYRDRIRCRKYGRSRGASGLLRDGARFRRIAAGAGARAAAFFRGLRGEPEPSPLRADGVLEKRVATPHIEASARDDI
jgi:hypothetical protein